MTIKKTSYKTTTLGATIRRVYIMLKQEQVLQGQSIEADEKVIEGSDEVHNRLKSAMKRAEQLEEATGKFKEDSQDRILEEQLAEYLADELAPSEDDGGPEFATEILPEEQSEPEISFDKNSSAKVQEIQGKQSVLKDMSMDIRNNCDALGTVAKQAEQIAAYLARTEDELIRLEENDGRLKRLKKASVNLADKFKQSQMTIADQQKTISLLEIQNKSTHELLQNSKLELANNEDENANLSMKLTESEMNSGKLENEKQSLSEKIELLMDERETKSNELAKTTKLLNSEQHRSRELELLVAKNKRVISEFSEKNDKQLSEINELRARYESMRDRMIEQDSEMKSLKQESTTARKELEEKLRLKQRRCQELESKMVVSEKQLATTEERLASLSFDLDSGKRIDSGSGNVSTTARSRKKDCRKGDNASSQASAA